MRLESLTERVMPVQPNAKSERRPAGARWALGARLATLLLQDATLLGSVELRMRGKTMPLYLSRFSYTPETWAKMIGNPEDRREAARSYIESVGGRLHGFWYAFGRHDGYTLWEAPDNVSMAAVALALSGGGALSSLETTVLLTVDETMDALRRADHVQYRAPGAS
jgi:uncharacterized protein with GYD domain